VPDSHSVGSSLPPGTPAVQRSETAAGASEILIENARLEFRVNDRKQRLAIESNRERMALSFHENHSKTAGPAKSGGTQTARRMPFVSQGKPALQGNDVVLRAQDRRARCGVGWAQTESKPHQLRASRTRVKGGRYSTHKFYFVPCLLRGLVYRPRSWANLG